MTWPSEAVLPIKRMASSSNLFSPPLAVLVMTGEFCRLDGSAASQVYSHWSVSVEFDDSLPFRYWLSRGEQLSSDVR